MQDAVTVDTVDRRQAAELMEDALNRVSAAADEREREYWLVMASYWADAA